MKAIPENLTPLRGGLIVSCQAPEGDPFRDSECIARFARTAVLAGAAGIRANGVEDVRAIRKVVPGSMPIIGLDKRLADDGKVLITPTFAGARDVCAAGASIIALDCTARGQRYGALERLRQLKAEAGVAVMADIARVEEALAAVRAGADLVGSTMRGYTEETAGCGTFEPGFIAELAAAVEVPVVAEGHIWTPSEACEAIAAGAFTVVVGTAITNPRVIATRFARALEFERRRANQYFLGIDLGGTRTKFGVVSARGELIASAAEPTPSDGGQEVLLKHLEQIAGKCVELAKRKGIRPAALGVATAGWVDPDTGRVVFATDNLPGWTGARIAETLRAATGLPVAVENDVNAIAVGERHFGLARGVDHFVCLTLGTGVGGGCYINGQLNRGNRFFASALGHITVERDGRPCTCGQKGCLEVYANSQALLRYAGEGVFHTAEELIEAANRGNETAKKAIRILAGYLASGIATLMQVLDPRLILIAGGVAQNNPQLLAETRAEVARRVTLWPQRNTQIMFSELGYYSGVFGACAVALEKTCRPK
jgi:predicted NBD/HSP70 family sugar kinase/putative N-acetylmannosamine-6-phosphate epimerase